MGINRLCSLFVGLTLFVGPFGVNAFAQNISESTNQDKVTNRELINGTSGVNGNITGGLIGVANGTGEVAGNITEGLGDAVNETGEALSNGTKVTIEGIQDLVNGSGQ